MGNAREGGKGGKWEEERKVIVEIFIHWAPVRGQPRFYLLTIRVAQHAADGGIISPLQGCSAEVQVIPNHPAKRQGRDGWVARLSRSKRD